MTDRSVKVSLILAAQGYMSGMDAVAQKTAHAGTELEKLNQKRQAFSQLGTTVLATGAAFGVGVGLAVSRFAEFDQQMSFVQARTHETAGNMDLLRDAALEAGARTVYSATEAAAAIEELAAAGVSTSNILSGGLDAALDLAAAGGLEVADAARIAATTLNQFKLKGTDATHVADLLAAGAGEAVGEVDDMAAALNQSGLVADQFGLSIEETTGTLAAFASNSLMGSDAGTSFRTMLLRLANPTKEVKGLMSELGFEAYDSQGKFIGLAGLAGELQSSLAGMTEQQKQTTLAMIFGQDAIRASTILLDEGEEGIRKWTERVDQQGYAADTAATRLDNLAGDLEALSGAFDTALIQSGGGANDALRGLVQTATGAVGIFTELPGPIQEWGVYLGIAAAGVGLVGGAALLATPRIAEFKAITQAAGFSLKGMSLAAGAVTLGLGAVIGIVAALAAEQAAAQARAESYATTLEEGTQRVTAATEKMVREQLSTKREFLGIPLDSAYDAADKLGISLDLVTDAALGNSEALRQLRTELEAANDGSFDMGNAYATVNEAVRGQNSSLEEAARVAEIKERADRKATRAAQEHESSVRALEGAASDASFEVSGLADQIRGFGSVQLDVNSATRSFYEAIQSVSESVAENGATLDVTTAAGRSNQAAVDDLARSTLDLAAATVTQTGDQESANSVIADGRQRLIEILAQFGITGQAAEDYANDLGLIPGNVDTAVGLNGVESAEDELNNLTRPRTATIVVKTDTSGAPRYPLGGAYASAHGNMFESGKVKAFAAGGFASGIYPGTPGGIHKFAEGHLPWETYISPDPAYRARNLDIWEETGRRLGAWQAAPAMYASTTAAAVPVDMGPRVNIEKVYGADADAIARGIITLQRQELAVTDALRKDGD